eukprot:TRINITY_DN2870_c0_g1_i3.p1 TRINITY_DN2870_c0_g1~~TRINITY_DN2870_c0_g1_i3.p1  ORF type:complete len:152 (-),score=24.15 TRINITY_DN2870_c0_g1_i3:44-499(-)
MKLLACSAEHRIPRARSKGALLSLGIRIRFPETFIIIWRFENGTARRAIHPKEKAYFWFWLYLAPVSWILLALTAIFGFKWRWLLIVVVGVGLGVAKVLQRGKGRSNRLCVSIQRSYWTGGGEADSVRDAQALEAKKRHRKHAADREGDVV